MSPLGGGGCIAGEIITKKSPWMLLQGIHKEYTVEIIARNNNFLQYIGAEGDFFKK